MATLTLHHDVQRLLELHASQEDGEDGVDDGANGVGQAAQGPVGAHGLKVDDQDNCQHHQALEHYYCFVTVKQLEFTAAHQKDVEERVHDVDDGVDAVVVAVAEAVAAALPAGEDDANRRRRLVLLQDLHGLLLHVPPSSQDEVVVLLAWLDSVVLDVGAVLGVVVSLSF